MGDKETIAKARQQLENLYLGVPDGSVDLTFKDMASFQQNDATEGKKRIHDEPREGLKGSTGLEKVPSLDFSIALQDARDHHRRVEEKLSRSSFRMDSNKVLRAMVDHSKVYDDVSAFTAVDPSEELRGRQRPGIPHTNLCALCSDYIYLFRHRCLVCGRVYCRKCVAVGMGEMIEGRKCVECLGRRFSQRYIQRAGQAGCCWRYRSTVKQQELKWAEKGPRRSGERRYRRGSAVSTRSHVSRSPSPVSTRSRVSRSRSPIMPKTAARYDISDAPASFVTSSTFCTSPHVFPI